MTDIAHVFPVADLVQHDVDTTEPDCVCGPVVQPVEREDGSIGWLIAHHSLDSREHAET